MHALFAPWVVPVEQPVIDNGAVVIRQGVIVDVGSSEYIRQRFPNAVRVELEGVLMPGLVNGHTHLELSHLAGGSELHEGELFVDWVESLIARRGQENSEQEIASASDSALAKQYLSGVVLLGDIANSRYDGSEQPDDCRAYPTVVRMLEFLAPTRQACDLVTQAIDTLQQGVVATAHAPYSTSPHIIQALKKRSRELGHPFSIHVAESGDEVEFIRKNLGPFRNFLEKRNSWDGTLDFGPLHSDGTVEYLNKLGVLDTKTLLVHCIHVSDRELEIIADSGANICLCPGSNEFLKVGRAPVEKMVNMDILPALGTDSLASNTSLDMWREMQLLAVNNSGLSCDTILAMATRGGARALQRGNDYGALGRGKSADFIHVNSKHLKKCRTREELIAGLVRKGRPGYIRHVADEIDKWTGHVTPVR